MYHSLFYGAWDESKCVRVRFSHAIAINNFDKIDMRFLSIFGVWIFLLTLNVISMSNQTQSHLPQFYGESRQHALLSNIFSLENFYEYYECVSDFFFHLIISLLYSIVILSTTFLYSQKNVISALSTWTFEQGRPKAKV